MIAIPSKTLFSRLLPSADSVRSMMAGMRPFAAEFPCQSELFVFKLRSTPRDYYGAIDDGKKQDGEGGLRSADG